MLKIEVEPKRLTDMLSKSLINAKGIESVSAMISPSGILFSDISKGVLAIHNQFARDFFTGFEVDEEKEIVFTKDFLNKFSDLRFTAEDSVTIEIDAENKCFIIRAGKKLWKPKLSELADNRIKFALAEMPGIGTLPTDPSKPVISQFSIAVNKLNSPDVEKVALRILEGEALSIELDCDGPFSEGLSAKTTRTMTPGVWTLFIEMFKNILGNFSGDVWVTMYEKIVFFTQVEENYSLMYLMSVT